jgi:predicted lipoprotein with Yx(FWY)xxD motif
MGERFHHEGEKSSMKSIYAATGLAAIALAVAACGSSSTSSTGATAASTPTAQNTAAAATGSGPMLAVKTIKGTKVLTNSKGFVLYWFAPDTPTTSKCYGSCATYWPPVTGPVNAGLGMTGTLGTITRSNGVKQATYDGHPLYTFAGDSAPGEAKGNGVNASGGLWYEMTASGALPAGVAKASTPASAPAATQPAAQPTATATAKSGGYGY